ncbi:glycosyltransferase family 2 protein [bacterium]|nr:glycosyltransferase family 2 protein [bacterium]
MTKLDFKSSNKEIKAPEFSIIIPHLKGKENLCRCLKSIYDHTEKDFEIILVDNGSDDNSVNAIYPLFPQIILIKSNKNLGFAGGCNAGMKKAKGKYIALLNDDIIATPNWLTEIAKVFDKDEKCGVCQPKLLSYDNKGYFEYAGSSGGYIDRYCYPFTRGRIFDTIEEDLNQYNDEKEIFWGAGAALIFKKELIDEIGLFDEDFFAHMEEIDFCFRIHGTGYKIRSVPTSVIYHKTASTLNPNSFTKMFLNHRNSLYLMLKNYPLKALLFNLFIRILLDSCALIYFAFKGQFKRTLAIILGYLACTGEMTNIIKKRKKLSKYFPSFYYRVAPLLYKRSIALEYYLLKKQKFSDLSYSIGEVQ